MYTFGQRSKSYLAKFINSRQSKNSNQIESDQSENETGKKIYFHV
jgi:hypothetical protein